MLTEEIQKARKLLERIQNIQANVGSVNYGNRPDLLLGVEHGLKTMTREDNYVAYWIIECESKIRSRHAQIRGGCLCGVCRVQKAASSITHD